MLSSLSKNIKEYISGEQPALPKLKLNTNENPYPPAPGVLRALQGFDASLLKLYPDPDCTVLARTIADMFGLKPENVFVGNGSDEVLAFCYQAFFEAGSVIVFPDVTYSFYPVYCALFGQNKREIPLDDDFEMNTADYIGLKGAGGIVIANPNAPTSLAVPVSDIALIAQSNSDIAIVVDEAYADFNTETAAGLIKEYENLVIVRTMSKSYSFAGGRVGFALGNKKMISALKKIKNCFNSYSVSALSQRLAGEALKDTAYFSACIDSVIKTREESIRMLRALDFTVLESRTNFLFTSHARVHARDIFTELKRRGIYVRHFAGGRTENWLRISVGTDEQMKLLMSDFQEII